VTDSIELQPGVVADLPLHIIIRDEQQPRTSFDEEALQELADDIALRGVQQPITVRPDPDTEGHYLIVYGERRWRASKLAERFTIPALLYNGEDTDDLGRLLDQVKENHLRKDLNPMEWAQLIHTMHEVHGLKLNQVEETLKQHAVAKFGRSYLSNLKRLLELPIWAQEKIANGELTAAHGKHLLIAAKSPGVLLDAKTYIEQSDTTPTVSALDSKIDSLFWNKHTRLDGWKSDFNHKKICIDSECAKCVKIKENHFCLDETCHSKHQAEWEASDQPEFDEQGEIIASDHDIPHRQNDLFNAYTTLTADRFDLTECQTCPNKKAEKETDASGDLILGEKFICTNEECFDRKQAIANYAESTVKQYMEHACADVVSKDPVLSVRLILWDLAQQPSSTQNDDGGTEIRFDWRAELDEDKLDKILRKASATNLIQFLELTDETQILQPLTYRLCKEAIHINDIILIWSWLGLSIDNYRVDQEYLTNLDEPHLQELIISAGFSLDDIAELEETLDDFALAEADIIGVPAEILWAYKTITEKEQHS